MSDDEQGASAAPAGFEAFSVPQEALAADTLESQGFETYSVDTTALQAPEPQKPLTGIIDRTLTGIHRSYLQEEGAADASDAVEFYDQAQQARGILKNLDSGNARNVFGMSLSPEQVATSRANAQASLDRSTFAYLDSVANSIKRQQQSMALPQSDARAKLSAVGAQGEGLVEQLGQLGDAVSTDPLGLLLDLTTENAVQLGGTLAAVAAARGAGAGRVGEMAAGYQTSQFNEFGAEYANLRAQGASHDEAWEKAGTKSGVVALFDAASFGVTGKAVDKMLKTSFMAKLKAAAAGTAEDAALGAGGEAWSQLAENGAAARVPLSDIFAEGFAELGGAPFQMLAQYPGRKAELAAAEAAKATPEPVQTGPDSAMDTSGEEAFGRVEPEIVGSIDIPDDAMTLDGGAAQEQVSPHSEAPAGFEAAGSASIDSTSESTSGSQPADEVPPSSSAGVANTESVAAQELPPTGGAGDTAKPSAHVDTPAGKESGKAPRPKRKPAPANTPTPPPKKGTVRYYHGGSPESVDGPLWVTSSRQDAEGWASRSPDMKVWYVDVPEGHEARGGGEPENGIPFPGRVELPKELADQRQQFVPEKTPLSDKQRSDLEGAVHEIGWQEKGGKLIRNEETGEPTGRTSWVGSDIWKSRPEKGGRVTEAEADSAIDKALAGKSLNAREDRWVQHVLDSKQQVDEHATYEREIPAEHHIDATDLKEALLTPDDRPMAELVQRAAQHADEDELEHALSALDDEEAQRRLNALIDRGTGRVSEAESAADETTSQGAQAPREAAAAEKPRPTDLFGVDVERQDQLNRGNERVARKLGEGRSSPPADKAPPGDMFRAASEKADADAAARQTDLDAAAHVAATSPHNALPEPTQEQKEAGNYQKGHIRLHGLDISIENPQGSTRSSKPGATPAWEVTMPHHYGYIRGTVGADKEHVDVTVGPHAEDETLNAYVIDQRTPDGLKFDEHKVMMGFESQAQAIRAYRSSFAGNFGHKMVKHAKTSIFSIDELKGWLERGDLSKPAHEFAKQLAVGKPTTQSRPVADLFRLPGPQHGGVPKAEIRVYQDAAGNYGTSIEAHTKDSGFSNPAPTKFLFSDKAEAVRDAADRLRDRIGKNPEHASTLKWLAKVAPEEAPAGGIGKNPEAQSKAVDANGVPLTLFHGTDKEFAAFEAGMFTSNRGVAENFAGGGAKGRVLEAHLDIRNPAPWKFAFGKTPQDLKAAGYDGAIQWDGKGRILRAVVTDSSQVKPVAAAPASPIDEALTIVRHTFASGMNRVVDLEGAIRAGLPFGVDVGLLSDKAMRAVVDAVVQGLPVFVDSGAFRVFRAGIKAQGNFEALNFEQILTIYEGLVADVGARNGDTANLYVVAPDVVGDQDATLKLLRLHAKRIVGLLNNGASVIVPLQRGSDGITGMAREVVPILSGAKVSWIWGIPSNAKAVTTDELRDFVQSGIPIMRVHLLGAASPKTAAAKLAIIREANEEVEVTLDGNILRSRTDALAGTSGESRTDAIRQLLTEVTGPRQDVRAQEFVGEQDRLPLVKTEAKPETAPEVPALVQGVPPTEEGVLGVFAGMLASGEPYPMIKYRDAYARVMGSAAKGLLTKRVDELVELAIVKAARVVAAIRDPGEAFDKMVALYERQPRLGTRTSTSVSEQAYSTPAPLAYVAARLAGVDSKTSVMEPTAGNGMLLITAKPANAQVNELNEDRAKALELQGFRVTRRNAATESLRHQGYPVDAVLANPPFGAVKDNAGVSTVFKGRWPNGDEWAGTNIDFAIALRALENMKPDGKAVLIIGGLAKTVESEEARSDGYNGSARRKFFFSLYRNYKVTDFFTVAGQMYERQGAGWPVDVIRIEGRGQSAMALPAAAVPRVYSDWAALRPLVTRNVEPESQSLGTDQQPAAPSDLVRAGTSESVAARPEPVSQPAVESNRDVASGVTEPGRSAGESRVADGGGRPAGGRREGGDGGRGRGAGSVESAGETTAISVESPPESVEPARDAGSASSVAGGSEGSGKPTARLGQRSSVAVVTGDAQAPYVPSSKANPVGTLVPSNMQSVLQDALSALEKQVGHLDDYVASQLGYKAADIPKYFSAEQVDALAMAINEFDRGAAYVIGDQTGVGKGRVVAGILRYAIRKKLIPIFVTEKPNLYADIYRDLTDIGQTDVRPMMTNTAESVPLDDAGNVVLTSPSSKKHTDELNRLKLLGHIGDRNMVFTTYSQMQTVKNAKTARMEFLEAIAPNAVIVFDESHNAGGQEGGGRGKKKDDDGEKTGRAGFARQLSSLAKAVMYSSATWAKRPGVMDLYARTDMALAVKGNVKLLPAAINAGGVPLQQVVAAMLTRAGQYVRRERSFAGVEYNTPSVHVDRRAAEQISGVMLAVKDFDDAKWAAVSTLKKEMKQNAEAFGADNAIGNPGVNSTNFTSIMHNLIDQMLLALVSDTAADRAIAALKAGEKPVITVANTMGSFIQSYAEEAGLNSGDPISLTFRNLLQRYLTRSRDVVIKSPDGTVVRRPLTDKELGKPGLKVFDTAAKLIEDSDLIGNVQVSPIDWMHSRLRKAGYKTGEITGRTHTVDYEGDAVVYRARSTKETSIAGRRGVINGFNNGDLDAIILNQAGSTGLSLHASEKFKNKQRRRMILAQAERNIDTHMQMLGRVHRTGQVIAPAYDQLVPDIPAAKRPAAVLAKKMASLNANTSAARESQFTSKETLDFLNVYGDETVAQLMEDMPEIHQRLGEPLDSDDKGIDRLDAARKLTGRLPLLPVDMQEQVYELIDSGYREALARADAMGENALEAKTLALDAKTIGRKVLQEAQESKSPFADGAYADIVDVKRIGKPYTSAQVLEKMAEALGAGEERNERKLERLGQAHRNEIIAKTGAAQDAYFEKERKQLLTSAVSDIRLTALTDRLRLTEERWRAKMGMLWIGGKYEVTLPNNTTLYGMVTNIIHKDRVQLPMAPGAWSVQFAVADGARTVTVPFSQLSFAAPGSVKFFVGVYVNPRETHALMGTPILQLFDQGQSDSRERRIIVTGNLLAAFATLGKGQITNYTDSEGSLRQGVLMPRSFDLDEFAQDQPVQLTPEQTRAFLRKAEQGKVTSSDGAVAVFRQGGEYAITVPSSKADGAKYFLNTDLRKITGDFVGTSGARMRAIVSPIDLQSAMEHMQKHNSVVFSTTTFKDEARAVGGTVAASKSVQVESKEGSALGDGDAGSLDVSYKPAAGEKAVPAKELSRHVRQIFRKSDIEVVVIDPNEAVPERFQRRLAMAQAKGVAGRWRAWAFVEPSGKRVILFAAGRFSSLAQVERIALHEAAHHGLDAIFGNSFRELAQRIYSEFGRPLFNDVIGDYFRKTPFDPSNPKDVNLVVNEYMAKLAEKVAADTLPNRLQAVWDQFLLWMKKQLNIQGFKRTFANAELRNVVRESVSHALNNEASPAGEHSTTDLGFSLQKQDEHTEKSQSQFWKWVKQGQPIDRVFRAAFTPFGAATIDKNGIWHVNPRFKAAARRAAAKLSSTATERFTWLHPLAEKARFAVEDTWGFRLKDRVLHGLVDRYGTPHDFIVRERQKESETRSGLMEAYKLGEKLMESVGSKEEAEALSAVLRGEEITDDEIKGVAGPVVDAIEDLGGQLVEAGVLSREAFERNRRKYHHRSYLRNEHVYGSPLAKWLDGFQERRRVRLQGDVFKGRGIRFDTTIENLKGAVPEEWWGSRFEGKKADVRLGATKWRALDRTKEPTDPAQVEGLPGVSQKKPKVLARVYWPAEEPVPTRFAGYKDRGVFEVRHVSPSKVTLWRDYNDEERQRMGEILDGRYNAVKTYSMMVKDLATAKFYGDIAKNTDWAQADEPRKPTGEVDWREARDITWRKHSSYGDTNWVRVPEGKIPGSQTSRYGQLAGMYVRAPIWRDLAELEHMQLPGTWKALLNQWKLNKTARSPVVHFNNVMSNFILMDLIDTRWSDLWDGIRSYAANDLSYQEAYRHGVFGGDSLDRDIRQKILDPILRELKDEPSGPGGRLQFMSRLVELLHRGDEFMKHAYQIEDEVFRMAAYTKFLRDGDSPEEAASRARRQFIDYDIRAPWVNAMRQTVLPFISYTYRAVPLLAEAVYNRPWKIAKYMTIAMVANAIGYALTGDDDEDRERRVMDEQYQGLTWLGTPRMVRMPWNDEYSNPAFLDIRRWIPAGDVFDMQGTAVDWMPASLQIGGPLLLAFELGANIDTYKDEAIYDKHTDTAGEAAGALALHAWQGFMPNAPWLPGSYSFENLANAAKGAKNGAYQQMPLGATVMGALGPKLRYQNTEYNVDRLRKDYEATERKLNDARHRLANEYARGRIDSDDLRDELTVIAEKRARAAQNLKEKINGPNP